MANYEIRDFSSLSETVQNLLRAAADVRQKSYCPYSNFAVGCAILTEQDEKVYTGCNIESSVLSPTLCAERTAVGKTVCDGYLKLKTVAVVAHQQDFTAPCGVCRQTLSEFRSSDGDIDIYLGKPSHDKVFCTKLSYMLPLAYVSYKVDSIKS
ncbi:hypothetical protein PYW07_005300 [Mythimna separata]|uniref:cytidine deaminase n=1 Tax=Mythimna separata TaxID=271217 RepID=A0AAD7YFJ5_MYTSE|nr:hypothetical protein PYW07_005300 [Mythimna separata]